MTIRKNIAPRTLKETEACFLKALDALGKGKLPNLSAHCDGAFRDRAWFEDRIRSELALVVGVRDARQAWQNALQKREQRKTQRQELVQALLLAVQNQVGSASPELKNWGFRPERKPEKPTGAEVVARTEKARATLGVRPKKKK
jgi:chromatin segregation and condensation protein Rec8/ScpA/Scc1 (kleisin family)